ncbi:MAG TPA: hypothetical protein VED40_07545 [Azospirillaceae bacterium]|nr:hypothetical protein [Azospirillaceae bacterium]
MSRYEERVYRSSTSNQRPDKSTLQKQLARLRGDLEQYVVRNPGGPMIQPLKARIREVEESLANIKAAEERRAKADQDRAERDNESASGRVTASAGRFPPRARPT